MKTVMDHLRKRKDHEDKAFFKAQIENYLSTCLSSLCPLDPQISFLTDSMNTGLVVWGETEVPFRIRNKRLDTPLGGRGYISLLPEGAYSEVLVSIESALETRLNSKIKIREVS